jgi:hypothetical protein
LAEWASSHWRCQISEGVQQRKDIKNINAGFHGSFFSGPDILGGGAYSTPFPNGLPIDKHCTQVLLLLVGLLFLHKSKEVRRGEEFGSFLVGAQTL